MYQNQQSSIFGGGYIDQQPINYNPNLSKAAFGSGANWHNEAANSRPNNGAGGQDAYTKLQAEMLSVNIPLH